MEKLKNKYYLSLLFFVGVWIFWAFCAPALLNYQEELQLFLFDSEYFMERITMPAGFARYVAEFLVQLYYNAVLGGAVIAALMTIMQLMMWQIVKKNCRMPDLCFGLTFIPFLLLWYFQGDMTVKLTFTIALLMVEIAMWVASMLQRKKGCYYAFLLVVTPLLAWLVGPVVLILCLFVGLTAFVKPKDWLALSMLVYAPVCIFISGIYAVAPLSRLFIGIGYTMIVDQLPAMQVVVMIAFAITPFCIGFVPKITNTKIIKNTQKLSLVSLLVMMVLVGSKCLNKDEYEVLDYDALVREENWDDIIAKAEKKSPNSPLTVAALNLALAMKGQLLQRGFDFYQNGWEGAFPKVDKASEITIMIAETYFYLGLVNEAMHLDFDSMEALADNAKSVRVIKRLAEINLINGHYEVARRYLRLLQKTMFYANWADSTMSLLDNEKAINDHTLYGYLRRLSLNEDFMFNDDEIDKVMGHLFMRNSDNSLAMQYLLFLPQLEGNEQKYMMYLNYVNKKTQRK